MDTPVLFAICAFVLGFAKVYLAGPPKDRRTIEEKNWDFVMGPELPSTCSVAGHEYTLDPNICDWCGEDAGNMVDTKWGRMRQSEYDARKKEEEAQERSRARAERRYETRQAAARGYTRSAGRGPINRSTAIHPGGTVVMVGGRELVLPAGSPLSNEDRARSLEKITRMHSMGLISPAEARKFLEACR